MRQIFFFLSGVLDIFSGINHTFSNTCDTIFYTYTKSKKLFKTKWREISYNGFLSLTQLILNKIVIFIIILKSLLIQKQGNNSQSINLPKNKSSINLSPTRTSH